MTEKPKLIIILLFGSVLVLMGVISTFLFTDISGLVGILGRNLGLALMISGCASVVQEVLHSFLRRNELRDGFARVSKHTEEIFDKVSEQTKEGFEQLSEETKKAFERGSEQTKEDLEQISKGTKESFDKLFGLLRGTGIQMVSPERRGNAIYHRWLLELAPQSMFFAGHSVLHRVQRDFASRGLISVEQALKQKVAQGSRIRILFLDPSWKLLDQLAINEGQKPLDLKTDLATTLGICKRTWEILVNESLPGSIEIRMCTELIQYAFHHVSCKEMDEDHMLVGFYFAGKVGMRSPLLLVENELIHEYFEVHMNTIFDRATPLLTYSRDGDKWFDISGYSLRKAELAEYIDISKLDKLA